MLCKICHKNEADNTSGICWECCEEDKKQPLKCFSCGKALTPDRKSVIFGTKKWDGHGYKYNCDCLKNKNIRVSIG